MLDQAVKAMPESVPGVITELDRIDGALEYTEDRLSRLSHRLEGVLRPQFPSPGEDEAKPQPSSEMAGRTSTQADRVNRIGRLLDDLADRLDV